MKVGVKMTKEEIIKKNEKLGFKVAYLPKDLILRNHIAMENGLVELHVSYDKNNLFQTISLGAFLDDIKEINIEIVNKYYDELINNIIEMKKVHLELLESLKEDK